jgi:hypothetical protein
LIRNKFAYAGIFFLLALAWGSYLPGLKGGFLFDDFVNLDAIGATGPIDDLPTLARYLTSGIADPTGRPLALLSFLLDARDWPADPAPFLRTNLLLHCINGLLLLGLLQRLGSVLFPGDPRRTCAAALLGCGIWLLHPLLVSTTLYVVQRESMLAATFCFASLWLYVAARERFARQPELRTLFAMAAAIAAGTTLSILCKANGVLLPVLALVLEATVLRRLGAADARLRRLRLAFLLLPTLAVLAYLATFLADPLQQIPARGWSVAQRLMTEPRALLSYLGVLAAPRVYSTGLYNDGFAASTSLLQPWTTLPSLLALSVLAMIGWRSREQRPELAAGIGFFFAGHLLESSSLPLELYFEHRNYLPAALLFWPLGITIAGMRLPERARIAIGTVILLCLGFLTWQRATVWSQPELLAKTWAIQNPSSSRAQATAAMFDTSAGRPRDAMARLGPIWHQRPGDLQIAFNYVDAACSAGGLSRSDAEALRRSIVDVDAGVRLIHGWLSKAIDVAADGGCPGLDLAVVSGWIQAMAAGREFLPTGDHDQEVEPLLGKLALRSGDPDRALAHFNRALDAFVTPDTAARQAALLATHGAFPQALAHLDHFARLQPRVAVPASGMPWLHGKVLDWQGYWPREMSTLRRKLAAEIAAQSRERP